LKLRLAQAADAPAIADVLRTAMRVSLPFLPNLHTVEEDLRFIADHVLPDNTVWVAEVDGGVVGFVAFRDDWIHHLYVHPDRHGLGIGPSLLDKALEDGQARQLWTFQENARARAFYESRGFQAVEFTDGSRNEEKTPDVRYLWKP
jgi:putative acetyltransferase